MIATEKVSSVGLTKVKLTPLMHTEPLSTNKCAFFLLKRKLKYQLPSTSLTSMQVAVSST